MTCLIWIIHVVRTRYQPQFKVESENNVLNGCRRSREYSRRLLSPIAWEVKGLEKEKKVLLETWKHLYIRFKDKNIVIQTLKVDVQPRKLKRDMTIFMF